ncbi:MAG: hypothetical protein HY043_09360 [Verrucomicrobia bacterium]|nr:hypothetical protein [Verrucomicrobiota bacterium]
MKTKLVSLGTAIWFAAALTACKKSEPTGGPVKGKAESSSVKSESGDTAGAAGSASEKGVLLKVKWPVGNRYVYRMDLDQLSTNKIPGMPKPMMQTVTMAMTYALTPVKETAGGGRDLEMEFLANEMEVKMGEQVLISFDSKETAKGDAQNPFSAPYRKMIGSKVHMQVNSDGKVEKIVGLKEWTDKVSEGVPEPGKGMVAQQFNEGFFRQMADYGRALPRKPIQEGETWPYKDEMPLGPMGKLAIDSKITFKTWEDHENRKCVQMTAIGTMKGSPGTEAGPMGKMSINNGTATGTTWFDPELGALVETSADQTMQVKGEMPGAPGGGGFTSDIGQKVTVKLVEVGKAK